MKEKLIRVSCKEHLMPHCLVNYVLSLSFPSLPLCVLNCDLLQLVLYCTMCRGEKKSKILLTPVPKFLITKRLSDNFFLLLSLSVLLSLSQYVVKPTAEHRSCCALVIWCSYFSWTELENFLWYNWMKNAGWQNEMIQTGAWLESEFGIFLFLRKSIVETVSSQWTLTFLCLLMSTCPPAHQVDVMFLLLIFLNTFYWSPPLSHFHFLFYGGFFCRANKLIQH